MNIYEIDSKLLETHPELIEKMRKDSLDFAKNFKDSPENMSDWGHKYFCPDDGGRLTFDLSKPHAHECKACGKTFQTEEFDNTWTCLYRRVVFETAKKLAVLYKLEKKEIYMQEYKKLLTFYADHYDEFIYHSKHVIITSRPPIVNDILLDAGKIMPQALNEADMMVKIITSFEILKDDLDKEFVDMMLEKMFKPAIEDVLKPQIVHVHNKPCLQNCCIAMIGLYFNDQELIDYAFDGEFGINTQLKEGVTEDSFWYEGSIHYQHFLLEGLVNMLAFAKVYDKKFETEQIIHDMIKLAYFYAFDNDIFPNPNDGWPNLSLKTYDDIYALAAKAFGPDSFICNMYKNILSNTSESFKPDAHDTTNFNHIMCFPYLDISDRTPIERTSMLYKSTYFALLKNKNVNVFMKYGHRSPAHSHPDKMNIEATLKGHVLSKDLSNPGYAANLFPIWYKRSISHNTVVVDGQDHWSIVPGILHEFNDSCCKTEAKEAYEGVDFKRDITLNENGFSDVFEVVSNDTHNLDYIFHCQATLVSELDAVDGDVVYTENGYQCFQDVKKINCSGDSITLKWLLNDVNVESTIDIAGKELFIVKTYDNPASNLRTAILLRSKSQGATFKIDWKIL